jgi:hypothetical protein
MRTDCDAFAISGRALIEVIEVVPIGAHYFRRRGSAGSACPPPGSLPGSWTPADRE